MSKIIYIAGLGHSGSTILDMSLGTLPQVVGLGELKTLLDDKTRQGHFTALCSCGKPATECDFWKTFPRAIQGNYSETEKYEIVINLLKEKYGEDVCLVDSSKNSYSYLKYLHENHELKVILLTRDVRSWSYSRQLSTGKPLLYFIIRWLLENIKVNYRIKKMGITVFKVGYEELALYPEFVFRKITDFAGLDYADTLLSPEKTNSHIISGNVARADKEKRMKWIYDARWMLSKRILLYSPFLLLMQRRNRRFVFSNIMKGSMKDFYMFGTHRKVDLSKKVN